MQYSRRDILKTFAIGLACLAPNALPRAEAAETDRTKPNILWVLTDDQRADSMGCFNRAMRGQPASPLGYVSSPSLDSLASEGVLFVNAYAQAASCAPSRNSMHTGRYPHRCGVYGFELHHAKAPFWRPTIPEIMHDQAGYQRAMFGKEGHYITRWNRRGDWGWGLTLYKEKAVGTIHLARAGKTDFHVRREWGKGKALGRKERFFYPDGSTREWFLYREDGEEITPEEIALRERTDRELGIVRAHTRRANLKHLILAGHSPQPKGQTMDGHLNREAIQYLEREADPSKPLFMHASFPLPHTPVLPPRSFAERFEQHTYRLPKLSQAEKESFPPQIRKLYELCKTEGMTDAEMQKMVQHYYAFCAYGDQLIGQLVDAFKAYSERSRRPWLILFVCGDNGWHLNEHGTTGKFGPWDVDLRQPMIVVSSDKKRFPPGAINRDLVELVDIAPTFCEAAGLDTSTPDLSYLDGVDLAATLHGRVPKRDHVLAAVHHVMGPRAVLRTKEYAFSMRTRPNRYRPGQDLDWVRRAKAEDLEMALYDLAKDPDEISNVAHDPAYRAIVERLRRKLENRVLGPDRVEYDWAADFRRD